jgi:peptidoglycan/LPS O-acetylase OafA/YrhL
MLAPSEADAGVRDADGHSLRRHSFYDPGLDVVRAMACVLVVFHHVVSRWLASTPQAWLATSNGVVASTTRAEAAGGGMGVIYFYALSAFLLSKLALHEQRDTGGVDLGKFWLRRCLRIWPLYYGFLLALLALGRLPGLAAMPDRPRTIGLFVFLFNWQGWQPGTPSSIGSILWSVCVEEQFYLLFTLGLAVLGVNRLPKLALAFVLLGPISGAVVLTSGLPYPAIWIMTGSHLDAFGIGMGAAWLAERRPWAPGRMIRLSMAVTALLAPAVLASVLGSDLYGGWWTLATYAFCALMAVLMIHALVGLRRPTSWLGGALLAITVWVGRRAYGIYVFHWFAIKLVLWLRHPGTDAPL